MKEYGLSSWATYNQNYYLCKGGALMTKVNCNVKNCRFWGVGDICMAEAIWVKNNLESALENSFYDIEFAEDMEDPGSGEPAYYYADTSAKTCCETMRARDEREEADTFFDYGPECR